MSAGAFFQRAFFLVRHHVDSSLPTELVKIFEILYKKNKNYSGNGPNGQWDRWLVD